VSSPKLVGTFQRQFGLKIWGNSRRFGTPRCLRSRELLGAASRTHLEGLRPARESADVLHAVEQLNEETIDRDHSRSGKAVVGGGGAGRWMPAGTRCQPPSKRGTDLRATAAATTSTYQPA